MRFLIILDGSLEEESNGCINSLKKMLAHLPDGINVDVTSVAGWNKKLDRVNIIEIEKKIEISIIKKIFLSTYFNGKKVNNQIKKILNTYHEKKIYDHVVVASSTANQYAKYMPKALPKTFILTDLPSEAFKRYFENSHNILEKIFYIKELWWSKLYEKNIINRYQNIILVNEKEVKKANSLYHTKVYRWVPVVFETPENIFHKQHENINLIFIGNMEFKPNLDGITYFYNTIFINLSDNYKLHLIGKSSKELFSNDSRVITYGFIPEIDDIMKEMDFGICYMINGGGMKNKIFDYLKYGIPCIANDYVFENNYINTKYLIRANTMQQFVEKTAVPIKEYDNVIESIQKYNILNVSDKFWRLLKTDTQE